jgi:hypothetical protein
MNRLWPFKTKREKIEWMRQNDAEISTMHSFAGNRQVTKMVRNAVKNLFDKEPRDVVLKELRTSWKEIERKYPEINERDIRLDIFWYLDGACAWANYEEIGMDEIKAR